MEIDTFSIFIGIILVFIGRYVIKRTEFFFDILRRVVGISEHIAENLFPTIHTQPIKKILVVTQPFQVIQELAKQNLRLRPKTEEHKDYLSGSGKYMTMQELDERNKKYENRGKKIDSEEEINKEIKNIFKFIIGMKLSEAITACEKFGYNIICYRPDLNFITNKMRVLFITNNTRILYVNLKDSANENTGFYDGTPRINIDDAIITEIVNVGSNRINFIKNKDQLIYSSEWLQHYQTQVNENKSGQTSKGMSSVLKEAHKMQQEKQETLGYSDEVNKN